MAKQTKTHTKLRIVAGLVVFVLVILVVSAVVLVTHYTRWAQTPVLDVGESVTLNIEPGTQWAEIADNLEINISDLIDVEHPDFVKNYGKQPLEMSQHDWLKLLDQTPKVLTYPIVIHGNRFLQIKNPSDFVKFLEPDSAGLEMS